MVVMAATTTQTHEVSQTSVSASAGLTVDSIIQAKADDGYNGPFFSWFPDAESKGADSRWVPLNRWGFQAIGIHTRPGMDLLQNANRTTQNTLMQTALMGQAVVWGGTGMLMDFANNLEPIKLVGAEIDTSTKSLGETLTKQPLIFGLITVALLVAALWTKARGRNPGTLVKKAIGTVGVFVIIAVMAIGAAKSTGGSDGEPYHPGLMSPGWILTKTQTVVGGVANGVLNGINTDGFATSSDEDAKGTSTCDNYLSGLGSVYDFADDPSRSGASVKAMSTLWQSVGLQAWIDGQFGTENKWANKVWCHNLDLRSGISPKEQAYMTSAGVANVDAMRAAMNWSSADDGPSKAFAYNTSDNSELDRVIIGWAACKWDDSAAKFVVEPDWSKKKDGETWISDTDCQNFFAGNQKTNIDDHGDKDKDGAGIDGASFNIGTGEYPTKQIQELTDNADITNFVRSFQGTDPGFGQFQSVIWAMVGALVSFVLFGCVMSISIIWAKLMSVFVMALLVLILVGSLFTKEGPGAKAAVLGKQMIGYTLTSSAASIIMLLVAWVTHSLVVAGRQMMGLAMFETMWAAISPLMAVFILHTLFKKLFNKPSPFSLKGANAWATGGAAAAGGVLAGGMMERTKNRALGAAGSKATSAGSGMLHKASGGRLGTSGYAQKKDKLGAQLPNAPIPGKPTPQVGKAAPGSNSTPQTNGTGTPDEAVKQKVGVKIVGGALQGGAKGLLAVNEHGVKEASRMAGRAAWNAAGKPTVNAVRNAAAATGAAGRDVGTTVGFLAKSMATSDGRKVVGSDMLEKASGGARSIFNGAKNVVDNSKAKTVEALASVADNPEAAALRVAGFTKGAVKVGGAAIALAATGGTAAVPMLIGGVLRNNAARAAEREQAEQSADYDLWAAQKKQEAEFLADAMRGQKKKKGGKKPQG